METIESALAAAYRKDYGNKLQNIKVDFNPASGDTKLYDIKTAILKQKSPSCGCGKIFEGALPDSNIIKGNGITTEFLKKHDINVVSEEYFIKQKVRTNERK